MTFKQIQDLKAQGAIEVTTTVNPSFKLTQGEEKLHLFTEEEFQQGAKMRRTLFVENNELQIFLGCNIFLKKVFFKGIETQKEKDLILYLLKDATVTLLQVIVKPGENFKSISGKEVKNTTDSPFAYNTFYKVMLTTDAEKLAQRRIKLMEDNLINF